MARETMAFTRVTGRRMVDPAAMAPVRIDAPVTMLVARPVADVAAAPPVLAREAMLFPTARLEEARVTNPEFFERTRKMRVRPGLIKPVRPGDVQPDAGSSRAELALPVAAADPVDPDQVFASADQTRGLYLPRYALAQRVVSGAAQYEIRIAAGADGQWALRAGLVRSRPPGVTPEAAAGEIDHEVMVQLRYQVLKSDGGTITKTLDFTEIGTTADGAAVIAQLRLATLAERDQVVSAITTANSACGIVVTRSVRVAVPVAGQVDRFRAVTRGLVQAVEPDPLFLNPALHHYLMDGVAVPTSGTGPGLVARQLQFEGSFHDYWEDAVDPACIYYLPDAFRLARRDSPAPFLPMMTVRVVPGATPEAEPLATLEFAATPWSNLRRLDAARREFAKKLPMQPGDEAPKTVVPELGGELGGALGGLLGGLLKKNKAAPGTPLGDALTDALGLQVEDARVGRVRMEPLPVEKAALWLALPGGAGGGLVERTGAQIDLRTAVVVSETMPLTEFQLIYDALMGGSVSLMRGELRVEPGGGVVKRIPFETRFDRMNGPMFETEVTAGGKPGQFSIRLTNGVESPVVVAGIDGSLLIDGHELPTTETVSQALPMTLAPGESMVVGLVPKRALANLPGGPVAAPMLDFGKVTLQPDSAALWAAILDADTTAEARRRVRVKLFPGMFDDASGKPENRAFAVIVQFEGGQSLELTPDNPEGEVTLAGGSVTDLVLRRAGTGGYRYRCQVIRRSARISDAEWREDMTDLLIPLLPEG